jgi:hypothetical protein
MAKAPNRNYLATDTDTDNVFRRMEGDLSMGIRYNSTTVPDELYQIKDMAPGYDDEDAVNVKQMVDFVNSTSTNIIGLVNQNEIENNNRLSDLEKIVLNDDPVVVNDTNKSDVFGPDGLANKSSGVCWDIEAGVDLSGLDLISDKGNSFCVILPANTTFKSVQVDMNSGILVKGAYQLKTAENITIDHTSTLVHESSIEGPNINIHKNSLLKCGGDINCYASFQTLWNSSFVTEGNLTCATLVCQFNSTIRLTASNKTLNSSSYIRVHENSCISWSIGPVSTAELTCMNQSHFHADTMTATSITVTQGGNFAAEGNVTVNTFFEVTDGSNLNISGNLTCSTKWLSVHYGSSAKILGNVVTGSHLAVSEGSYLRIDGDMQGGNLDCSITVDAGCRVAGNFHTGTAKLELDTRSIVHISGTLIAKECHVHDSSHLAVTGDIISDGEVDSVWGSRLSCNSADITNGDLTISDNSYFRSQIDVTATNIIANRGSVVNIGGAFFTNTFQFRFNCTGSVGNASEVSTVFSILESSSIDVETLVMKDAYFSCARTSTVIFRNAEGLVYENFTQSNTTHAMHLDFSAIVQWSTVAGVGIRFTPSIPSGTHAHISIDYGSTLYMGVAYPQSGLSVTFGSNVSEMQWGGTNAAIINAGPSNHTTP